MLIFGLPPLAAVQLLWINLLTDSTCVISLTVEGSEENVMYKKPLALTGHLFSRNALLNMLSDSLVIATLTLISFAFGGQSMAFATLVMIQVFHSYNMKTQQSLLKADFKTNKFMNFSSVLVLFISVFLVLTPAGMVFGLETLSVGSFLLSLLLSIIIIPINEFKKIWMQKIIAKQ